MKKLKPNGSKKILVVVGPTASGKSALAVVLAKKYDGEIISADSRQVYRGLDIGSGKITSSEMKGVRHHLLDVFPPQKIFTAADFKRLGKKALKEIWQIGKLPIICGGTSLYIDSLIFNLSIPKIRPQPGLRAELEKKTTDRLFAELKKMDPVRAENIDRHNRRRLIRALEIVLITGQPVPPLKKKTIIPPENILWLGLKPDPEALKNKISKRLNQRLKNGLIEEVRQLREKGLSWEKLESLGLEYRWIAYFLQGKMSSNQMRENLGREIERYAKRQMTWLKRNKEINWLKNSGQGEILTKLFLKNNL